MNKDNEEFGSKFPYCEQVKVEHQMSRGLTHKIELVQWKWDKINMDFITRLLRFCQHHHSIWVIVYRMTKSAHILLVETTHSGEDYAGLYIQEVERLWIPNLNHFI